MSNLKDKVAVVTGASKGIGAAIAKRLSEAGAAVVVNYSTGKEEADRVVGDIRANGGKAIAVKGDVAKAADMQRLFAETKKVFNRLDDFLADPHPERRRTGRIRPCRRRRIRRLRRRRDGRRLALGHRHRHRHRSGARPDG